MAHEPSGTDGQQSAAYDQGAHAQAGPYGPYEGAWQAPADDTASAADPSGAGYSGSGYATPDYSAAYGGEYAYGQYGTADHTAAGQGQSGYAPSAYGETPYGRPEYDPTGYRQSGYHQPDYSQSGYSESGYGRSGYSDTYDRTGYDTTGQAPSGYAAGGYGYQPNHDQGADGTEQQSYTATGYGANGYEASSYDSASAYYTSGYPADPGTGHQDAGPAAQGGAGFASADAAGATQQWSTQDYADYGQQSPPPTAEPTPAGRDGSAPAPGSPADETPAEGVPAAGPSEPTPRPAGPPLLGRLLGAVTGTDRRTLLIRAGAGGAALVALVGAGFVLLGGGSGKSAPAKAGATAQLNLGTSHTKAWSAAFTAAAPGSDGLVGSWLTDKAVVRGDGTGVTAYAVGDGHKLWTLAAPASGAVPCAMSPGVNGDGLGAVLFQPKAGSNQPCTSLVAVDSATGQAKWSATVAGTTSGYSAAVGVTDTRAVVVGDKQAVGYDAATGKQSWSYTGPGKFCTLSGDAGTSTVVVQSSCADTTPKQQVIQLDAASGRLVWWRGLPDAASSFTVLSASPVAVAVNQSRPGTGSIMTFSDTGTSQPAIQVSQNGGTLATDHGAFSPAPTVFFEGGTMITTLTPATAAPGASTTVAGYDLATGRQLWSTPLAEKGQAQVVGIDGTAAIVATEERTGQPARLDRLGLTDGKETQGGGFPAGTGSLLTAGRVLYNSSLAVVLPSFASSYNAAAVAYQAAG